MFNTSEIINEESDYSTNLENAIIVQVVDFGKVSSSEKFWMAYATLVEGEGFVRGIQIKHTCSIHHRELMRILNTAQI